MNKNRGEKRVHNYIYNLEAQIGEGSFSQVFKGKNEKSNEVVAIKVVTMNSLKTQTIKELLQNEISVMKHLNHPNIVRLYEVLSTMNNIYIVEEFCEGGDVGKVLLAKGKLQEGAAFQILKDIVRGFSELIKHGIIHRDLKPANIFISKGLYKLGDFGFAKPVNNIHERIATKFIGTPLYMSPQCLQNRTYSSKCDIWAMGVTYYQLLTGKTPWACNNHMELLQKIFTQRVLIPQNIALSDWSVNFLMRTLNIDEQNRISWEEIFSDQAFVETKKEVVEIKTDESQSTNSDEKEIHKVDQSNILFSNKFLLHLDGVIRSLEQARKTNNLSEWLYEKIFFLTSKHRSLLLNKIKLSSKDSEFELENSLDKLESIFNEYQKNKNFDLLAFDERFFTHFNLNMDNETEFHLALQYYLRMAIRQCNHHLTLSISSNIIDSRTDILMMMLRSMTNYYQALMIQNDPDSNLDTQKLSRIFSSFIPANTAEGYQKLREKIYILNI